jgi:hypothetical protein
MNERIRELVKKAGGHFSTHNLMSNPVQHRESIELWDNRIEKFAELLIEEVLNEVKERAYYTGDRDWSDEVDRPWIQLEFGYGSLADAKKGIFK